MYRKWTKNDIEASKARFRRLYAKSPIEYRFLCGHDIQSEDDEDALDYYMIGVWLVQHRKYSDWSKEKSFDLADILEFMRVYRICCDGPEGNNSGGVRKNAPKGCAQAGEGRKAHEG